MGDMTDMEQCAFIKVAVETLESKKKDEVMKCVGQFVFNPEISKLNKQIENFQKQCKHLDTKSNGKCSYCGKQISSIR